MKFAILLRGHTQRTTANNSDFIRPFHYKNTVKSFRENITDVLTKMNIDYDIYCSVKVYDEDFIKEYKPIYIKFNENTTQFEDIKHGLEQINNKEYEHILVLRVDLLYKLTIDKWNIKLDKINYCWRECIPNWIGDNIYTMNPKFIKIFINTIDENKINWNCNSFGQTYLPNIVNTIVGLENVNFLFKETYNSGTNWNTPFCNNPLYIIYGYKYYFGEY